jgi:uncharacterized beta barrel domain-containing protein DUF5777
MKPGRLLLFVALLAIPGTALSQERPRRWQRRGDATALPLTVFHSTQSANLPTAETVGAGELIFEISHRFLQTVSSGPDTFWGLDGSVNNRLGLAFGIHDRVMLGITHSNLARNLDLSTKVRVAEGGEGDMPWMLGFVGGVAINPGPDAFEAFDDRSFQYYAQGIFDIKVGEELALGVVPSVLNNVNPLDASSKTTLGLGIHGQFYLNEAVSFLGEWQFVESNSELAFGRDAGSLGVEFETGGHFFKLLISNSTRLNSAQFLAGAADSFAPDNWRLGFNITRILTF